MNRALLSDQDLLQHCEDAEDHRARSDKQLQWMKDVQVHLDMVAAASYDEFRTREFQRKLWSSKAISNFGRGGAINVDELMADQHLIGLLWKLRDSSLPPMGTDRTTFLVQLYKECIAHIRTKLPKRPKLKLFNVFASLLPSEFLTLSFTVTLRTLAEAMGINAMVGVHPVLLHRAILDRLAAVLGDVPAPPHPDGVRRMTLPWLLFSRLPKQADATTESDPDELPGEERLRPRPADLRRRSMMTINGGFATVRTLLEFAKEGCAREDFKAHIRSVNPNLSSTSVDSTLNALIAEWDVLAANGDQLTPTPRGLAVLENDSAEPYEVSDWLLTRILGFDHILYALRERNLSFAELIDLLRQVNPGWTSPTMPGRILEWQRSLGLVKGDSRIGYALTEEGQQWAERIDWAPEFLPSDRDQKLATFVELENDQGSVQLPQLSEIVNRFPGEAVFPASLIARLHAGLWSNEIRHFAILSGLSGSGKTLFARRYALSLWHDQPDQTKGLYTEPVQPGWHDPSSLLGYINPLASDTYVRTGFLNFLLRASADPSRPYTVVLDEMNLSHPEQYMAPLLSAMETGDMIELHALDDDVSGVPPRIRYPHNLLIIGTVNMDETTHGLSDKILDRAAVTEFWDVNIDAYPGWNSSTLGASDVAFVRRVLFDLYSALRPIKRHFGWRTISDILGYVTFAQAAGGTSTAAALDQAIFSKILPKLRGEDSTRLRQAFEQAHLVLKDAQLPESTAKLGDLRSDLRDTGSARFWR